MQGSSDDTCEIHSVLAQLMLFVTHKPPILLYGVCATGGSPEHRALKARCHLCPCLSHSRFPPCHSVSTFLENESPGSFRPVPISNNGRISTTSGLTVSCSHPGCERLKEGGGLHTKGDRKVPGNHWSMGTCEAGHVGIWSSGWEAEPFILGGNNGS